MVYSTLPVYGVRPGCTGPPIAQVLVLCFSLCGNGVECRHAVVVSTRAHGDAEQEIGKSLVRLAHAVHAIVGAVSSLTRQLCVCKVFGWLPDVVEVEHTVIDISVV